METIPFDSQKELAQMRAELECNSPELLTDKSSRNALKESAEWHREHTFAGSWFEDDAEVDRVIEKAFKKDGRKDPDKWVAVDAILNNILEKRRHLWLERLTLNALWLKSCRKPPLLWHQMFFLAEAVADKKNELVDIPLMESIAVQSLGAYLGRREDGDN
jgi:hypothetical protein